MRVYAAALLCLLCVLVAAQVDAQAPRSRRRRVLAAVHPEQYGQAASTLGLDTDEQASITDYLEPVDFTVDAPEAALGTAKIKVSSWL